MNRFSGGKHAAASRLAALFFAASLLCCDGILAQQKGALTNASVVSMVKGGMSESVILYVIKNRDSDFTTTPVAVQELKKGEVSQKIIDAMIAAKSRPVESASGTPAGTPAARGGGTPSQRQPFVLLTKGTETRPLPALIARVTSAKVERKDLGSLATQGAVTRALEGTADLAVDAAVSSAASSIGSSVASPVGNVAKGVIGGLFKSKPKLTYLWAIPVQIPLTPVPQEKPRFEVHYRGTPQVSADDFTPVIVRLIREKRNDWRLVGASEGEPDALESEEWEIYDDFSQEEVSSSVTQRENGPAIIEPDDPLDPGEYAICLRPTSGSKAFSGPEIVGNTQEGRLFNSVWGFKIEKK